MRYALMVHNQKDLRRLRIDMVNQTEIYFCMVVPSMDKIFPETWMVWKKNNTFSVLLLRAMNKEKLLEVLLTRSWSAILSENSGVYWCIFRCPRDQDDPEWDHGRMRQIICLSANTYLLWQKEEVGRSGLET